MQSKIKIVYALETMCGFLGFLHWQRLPERDEMRIAAATERLHHRGPDAAGVWRDTYCVLGFRRLKILDLSEAGDQPMQLTARGMQLVYNGEIYNFRELRSELEKLGCSFQSSSDTEVLLQGCATWGVEALLPRLRGMFAFALWDARADKLWLARDPLGVKPLYFYEDRDGVYFASEPKAIFAALGRIPEPDPCAMQLALTYRYVPAPRSGFKDLEKLPAGHLATVDRKSQRLQYWAWFRLPLVRERKAGDPGAIVTELKERLQCAVQRRLVSDVPLGAWLSGGIDSGLIVSQMPRGTHTFSAGFASPEFDERPLAAKVARHLQTVHTQFEIPESAFDLLPRIVWAADEPYFDSSALPTYLLAQASARDVKVTLSGDGGDESFAGYRRYFGLRYLAYWKLLPDALRKMLLNVACRLSARSRSGLAYRLHWLQTCSQSTLSGFHPYLGAATLFSPQQLEALQGVRLREENEGLDTREYMENVLLKHSKLLYPELPPRHYRLNDAEILQRCDLETYLPEDVLFKTDRMSMAHGLEVRGPFLDVDLLEWALSLPQTLRQPDRRTKPLLRCLAQELLPPQVVNAPKRGFGVPLDAWFRGVLKTKAAELFESSELAREGWLRQKFWEPYWSCHQSGKAQHGERLYALIYLELWYRMYCCNTLPERLSI